MKKSNEEKIEEFINFLQLEISILKQSNKYADIVRLSQTEYFLKLYKIIFNNNFEKYEKQRKN